MEVQQLLDMGFSDIQARWALSQTGNNVEQAIERLLNGGGAEISPPLPTVDIVDTNYVDPMKEPGIPQVQAFDVTGEAFLEDNTRPREHGEGVHLPYGGLREDQDLSTALEMSMREQRGGEQSVGAAFLGGGPLGDAPIVALAVEAAAHDRDLPCGLRNIGNTCYVNSFLQTLLHIDDFRERILHYRNPAEHPTGAPAANEPEAEQGAGPQGQAFHAGRREHCIRLVGELRQLFAYGLFTSRSCIDPTRLLGELVDERGQKLQIGSQEDVGEFMLKFLERLDEGLRAGVFEDEVQPSAAVVSPWLQAPDAAGAGAAQEATQSPDKTAEAPVAAVTGEAASVPDAATGQAPAPAVKESSPSPLQALFFGQQVQVFSYRDVPAAVAADGDASAKADAEPRVSDSALLDAAPLPADAAQAPGALVVSEEKGEFLQIFLDVKHKDLYSAWEAANCTQVDYITPSGSSTEASTSIWIERLPKLLSFQLQRVGFDQEKKVQVKIDESFLFDQTLHVDRFLRTNREAAQAAAARVRELRERREQLQQACSRFQEYQGRAGLGVAEVLGLAAQCLEENVTPAGAAAATAAATNGLQLELCDPHRVAAAGLPEAAAVLGELQVASPAAVQLLRSLRANFLAQEAALTAEIDRLDAEVGEAHRDLRQYPYELHAIWVHQGIAGSGHYWAYVKDWQHDRWLRYDDSLVTVVEWEDVRTAAVGQNGSNTSAYVLVYVNKELAASQSQSRDHKLVLEAAEALLQPQLIQEIHIDNGRLQEEQAQQREMAADQDLRQHAEAVFQHYAGLIHKWEPEKKIEERSGNAHDPNARKNMHDSALTSFQLFLLRLHGEQSVWTHLLMQSIDAQRQIRNWTPEHEGRILYFLANTMRSQKCYASMLRDKMGSSRIMQCEMEPLELPKLTAQYNTVLLQAHIIDESIQALKDDGSHLVKSIGALAFIWAHWNLEADDKFRQNEVLLIMSTLIHNTITLLVKHRDNKTLSEPMLMAFLPTCEYFWLLLVAVEWPNTWKQPLISKIGMIFPQLSTAISGRPISTASPKDDEKAAMNQKFLTDTTEARKEVILHHPMTQLLHKLADYERTKPEPGRDFFERHRTLYNWLMSSDEAISASFVISLSPNLHCQMRE